MKKILLRVLLTIISFFIFWWLESGFKIEDVSAIIKPLVFASSVFLTFSIRPRRYLFYVSLLFYFLMVFLYLILQINLANLAGSLGVGILIVLILSYLGDLIKNGYLEKL